MFKSSNHQLFIQIIIKSSLVVQPPFIFRLQITLSLPRQPVTLAMGTPQNIVHGAYTTDRRMAQRQPGDGSVVFSDCCRINYSCIMLYLVNVYITMEINGNHHFSWENSRCLWWFSIVMLNYRRVVVSGDDMNCIYTFLYHILFDTWLMYMDNFSDWCIMWTIPVIDVYIIIYIILCILNMDNST